jgi:small-conductance mechanosensitive channel
MVLGRGPAPASSATFASEPRRESFIVRNVHYLLLALGILLFCQSIGRDVSSVYTVLTLELPIGDRHLSLLTLSLNLVLFGAFVALSILVRHPIHERPWWALKGKGIEIPFPQRDPHIRTADVPVFFAQAEERARTAGQNRQAMSALSGFLLPSNAALAFDPRSGQQFRPVGAPARRTTRKEPLPAA